MPTSPKHDFPEISAWIARTPIAHRGLHDRTAGRYENTLSAARAAVKEGFAIEVDLHPSADGVAMVFHDHTLDRLTAEKGNVRERKAEELSRIAIGGTQDRVPTLRQLLDLVDGQVGLVLELKGQTGADDGFVASVARDLEGYRGPVALMSFDRWLVEDARRLVAGRPIGLTAEGDETHAAAHREIADAASVDFVSYGIEYLPNAFVAEFRNSGRPVITWTIRSPQAAAKSALYADQITFEGFDPRL